MAQLDLKTIINITVNLASRAAARKGYNVALILGDSDVIKTEERVRIYTSVSAMLDDGFTTGSEEYRAASLYFSANSSPQKLAVGVKGEDETFLEAAQACRSKNGEWYVLIPLSAEASDIVALAQWAEAATPDTILAYTTSDESNLQETAGTKGVFETLKATRWVKIAARLTALSRWHSRNFRASRPTT